MIAALRFTALTLRLNLRNPMTLIYGYLFPLVFLGAFAVIYRHDGAPLISHLGALLTVTALGGACFGLPTAIVAKRERGVWRRYRATPAPVITFIFGIVASRLVLLVSAATLQLTIALVAFGMPLPRDPIGLSLAFILVSCALIGLGLIVAMIANTVPAVQALGQCIFLPMLMIGGVAVRLSSLPDWTQALSAFLPGRYAVEAIQGTATGGGLAANDLLALVLFTLSSGLVAASLFRWDTARRRPDLRLLTLGIAMWFATGAAGTAMHQDNARPALDEAPVPPSAAFLPPRPVETPMRRETPQPVAGKQPAQASWRDVDQRDIARIAFDRLPDDSGFVSPMAQRGTLQDAAVEAQIAGVRTALPGWPPAQNTDPVQRARNMLYIVAVPDVLQMDPLERYLPWLAFDRLRQDIPPHDLPLILYWIAQHPDDGSDAAAAQLAPLGLPQVSGPTKRVRERAMIYALKFLKRLEAMRTEAES